MVFCVMECFEARSEGLELIIKQHVSRWGYDERGIGRRRAKMTAKICWKWNSARIASYEPLGEILSSPFNPSVCHIQGDE